MREGLNPDTGDSFYLARHWLSIHDPDRAIEALARVPTAAESAEAHGLWTAALMQLERYEEAEAAAQRGLALEPEHEGLLQLLASTRWRKGDRAGAERAFLEALALVPDDPVLLASYGLLVAEVGQLDKAERLIDQAVRSGPEVQVVRYAQSLLSYLRGDPDAARLHARGTLEIDPEEAVGHAVLGWLSLEAGEFGGARSAITAARLDPEDRDYREAARHAAVLSHPLMRPLLPVYRIGPAKVWLGAIAAIILLRVIGLTGPAAVVAVVYVVFALYSWVAPPLVRRILRRRR